MRDTARLQGAEPEQERLTLLVVQLYSGGQSNMLITRAIRLHGVVFSGSEIMCRQKFMSHDSCSQWRASRRPAVRRSCCSRTSPWQQEVCMPDVGDGLQSMESPASLWVFWFTLWSFSLSMFVSAADDEWPLIFRTNEHISIKGVPALQQRWLRWSGGGERGVIPDKHRQARPVQAVLFNSPFFIIHYVRNTVQ